MANLRRASSNRMGRIPPFGLLSGTHHPSRKNGSSGKRQGGRGPIRAPVAQCAQTRRGGETSAKVRVAGPTGSWSGPSTEERDPVENMFVFDGRCHGFSGGRVEQRTGEVLQFLPLCWDMCGQEELLCGQRGCGARRWCSVSEQELSGRTEAVASNFVARSFKRVLQRRCRGGGVAAAKV